MITYHVAFTSLKRQIIHLSIQAVFDKDEAVWTLPKWRPGRYAFQSYHLNIADINCTLENGEKVEVLPVDTHSWRIIGKKNHKYVLSYSYYAKHIDAGGTYLDEEYVLFNGIHCLLYQKDKEQDECQVHLTLPPNFQISRNWNKDDHESYRFSSFHELVDSPFIAAQELIHYEFHIKDLSVSLWFMGTVKPDLSKIEKDFIQFSEAHLSIFGSFPVEEYHYLFWMLPYKFYHGVEHKDSTMIVLGPSYHLMNSVNYRTFLELSSHEFFHVWNVKAIRPADLLPYDYSAANYSELHYITEGVTTYYGDLTLWKSQIWGVEEWIESVNKELKRYYLTPGKDYVSLEESSFTSWVNGYQSKGYPARKISFYNKGYLTAMLLDLEIMEGTNFQQSMDVVLHRLYQEFGIEEKGYTGEDYKRISEEVAQKDLSTFFQYFISGTRDLYAHLEKLANYMGFILTDHRPASTSLAWYGLQTQPDSKGMTSVKAVWPSSSAESAGMHLDDTLVAINGHRIDRNLDEWLEFYEEEEQVILTFFRLDQLKNCILIKPDKAQVVIPQFSLKMDPSEDQLFRLASWQRISSIKELSL